MCDYSLHHVTSRPAKVSDKLVTTELARSSTRGFAAVGEHGAKLVIHDDLPKVAVCLLPGTELAFDGDVRYDRAFNLFGNGRINHKVARFRQIDMDDPHAHHDALEFPNGQLLKVTQLVPGQTATVLQLPVAMQHPEPVEAAKVRSSSDSRLALNRVSFTPGIASILVPSQGSVMLWQSLRNAAIGLSTTVVQSFRRLKAHKRHPVLSDAGTMDARFNKDVLTARLPKQPKAQKPKKKMEIKAAA
jgi:hypothetical protein